MFFTFKSFNSNYLNNSIISFIFIITNKRNNVYLSVADLKGTIKWSCSAASLIKTNKKFLTDGNTKSYETPSFSKSKSSKQLNKEKLSLKKKKRSSLLMLLLKSLMINTKSIQNNIIALHFNNTRVSQEVFISKFLKSKFYIAVIKSFNLKPHNGCRAPKLRRIKRKPILLILEK